MIGNINFKNNKSNTTNNMNISELDLIETYTSGSRIITQEQFINILNHNIFSPWLIGVEVSLESKMGYYNNDAWLIIDVNHDSENTGQNNYYDLACYTGISGLYHSTTLSTNYRNSEDRNTTISYYDKFSSTIKNHMIPINYFYNNNLYTDDYIVIPSINEFYNIDSNSYNGKSYPLMILESNRGSRKTEYNDSDRDIPFRTGGYYTQCYIRTNWDTYQGAFISIIRVQ